MSEETDNKIKFYKSKTVNIVLPVLWIIFLILFIIFNSIYIYSDRRPLKKIIEDKNSKYNINSDKLSTIGSVFGLLTNVMYARYLGPYLFKNNIMKILTYIIFIIGIIFLIMTYKAIKVSNSRIDEDAENNFAKFQLSIQPLQANFTLLTIQALTNILNDISPTDEYTLLFGKARDDAKAEDDDKEISDLVKKINKYKEHMKSQNNRDEIENLDKCFGKGSECRV